MNDSRWPNEYDQKICTWPKRSHWQTLTIATWPFGNVQQWRTITGEYPGWGWFPFGKEVTLNGLYH